MAKHRTPEGQATIKGINTRISAACGVGFLFLALARLFQDRSTVLAVVWLAIGWSIWLYAMVLVFRKRRIK